MTVDLLLIEWASGRRQSFENLEVNQALVIEEITGVQGRDTSL